MLKENMLNLREGQRVFIHPASGYNSCEGTVRGVTTNPVPVLGRTVIVEPDVMTGFEFSHIGVFEVHLRALD